MATYSRKLKDASGNYICPVTRAEMVYFSDDTKFDKLTFYPIGSIFQSFEETSPASLFGGEWEKVENTFLYGSGSKNVGDTGGEEAHKLTINEIPSHDHYYPPESLGGYWGYGGSTQYLMAGNSAWAQRTQTVYPQGGSQSHNNMPPYTVCNIWKRTA